MTGERSQKRIYQSKANMVGGAFGTIAFLFIGLSAIVAAPSIAQKAVWGTFGLLASAAMYRYAQSKLIEGDPGVTVSNPWSRYELRWEEIDGFEIGRWKISTAVCLIHLRNGDVKPALGIAGSANFSSGSARRMVDELNQELSRRT